MNKVILGLQILQKYFHDKDGWHLHADNDEIHVLTTEKPVTVEDFQMLRDLSWFQMTADGCKHETYDPKKRWKIIL